MHIGVVVFFGLYAVYFGVLLRRWLMMTCYTPPADAQEVPVTVIIPARNEAAHIDACLDSVRKQEYSFRNLEVLVVSDHSEDATVTLAESHRHAFEGCGALFRVIELANTEAGQGKKAAITAGIRMATHSLIITTDADTLRNKRWLAALAGFCRVNEPVMVCGPVTMKTGNALWEHCQAIEFSGLTGAGGASLEAGMPTMCNGANLAFRKEAFDEVGGYAGYDNIASGDDEFLMHKLSKRYPGKVRFLKSREAIVYTYPLRGIRAFFRQRLRWASKGRHYNNRWSAVVGLLVGSTHAALVLLLILYLVWGITGHTILLAALILKTVPEFLFLLTVLRFYRQAQHAYLYWPLQPVFWLYVLAAGIMGTSGNYAWKGRQIREGKLMKNHESH